MVPTEVLRWPGLGRRRPVTRVLVVAVLSAGEPPTRVRGMRVVHSVSSHRFTGERTWATSTVLYTQIFRAVGSPLLSG